MFDFVQEKKRFVYIILVLMVLPFAFFGVDSYRHSGNTESPATVNGTKVSAQELEGSLRQQQEQLAGERAQLLAKNEQARSRVEAMITRLKSLEQHT